MFKINNKDSRYVQPEYVMNTLMNAGESNRILMLGTKSELQRTENERLPLDELIQRALNASDGHLAEKQFEPDNCLNYCDWQERLMNAMQFILESDDDLIFMCAYRPQNSRKIRTIFIH